MKIISRKSTLAKIQARLVADKINAKVDDFKFELITKETSGDIDLTTPLHPVSYTHLTLPTSDLV